MTANPIERLDVPLRSVEASVTRLRNLLAPAGPSQPASDGELAEYRHLLYDADPDATTRPFIEIHHHASTRRSTS